MVEKKPVSPLHFWHWKKMTKSDLLRTAADVCTWQDGRRGDSRCMARREAAQNGPQTSRNSLSFSMVCVGLMCPVEVQRGSCFRLFPTCLAWEIPSHGQNKRVQTYAMNSRGRFVFGTKKVRALIFCLARNGIWHAPCDKEKVQPPSDALPFWHDFDALAN